MCRIAKRVNYVILTDYVTIRFEVKKTPNKQTNEPCPLLNSKRSAGKSKAHTDISHVRTHNCFEALAENSVFMRECVHFS